MNQAEKIKQMIREAELYRSQGLINEALDTYRNVQEEVRANTRIKNRDSLLEKISSRIDQVSRDLENLRAPSVAPQVSEQAQKLIKEMFSFDDPGVKGSASLGGAVSLAEFGQYKSARQEFESLFDYDNLRLEAAENVLKYGRRHMSEQEMKETLSAWKSDPRFSEKEITELERILQEILGEEKQEEKPELSDDDILDISSVSFELPSGPDRGQKAELDINYQNGRHLNIIVSKKSTHVTGGLKNGTVLEGVVFYSPMAIFSGTAAVVSTREITAGPKQGDFSLDLEIMRIES